MCVRIENISNFYYRLIQFSFVGKYNLWFLFLDKLEIVLLELEFVSVGLPPPPKTSVISKGLLNMDICYILYFVPMDVRVMQSICMFRI